MKFKATVTVFASTIQQAEKVLAERLGYDEDYGFDYTVDWSKVALDPSTEVPGCTCPAGTYDWPNAVHEPYCALNET